MNEAYLKGCLKKALVRRHPQYVVYRHEDLFTGGMPDMSVSNGAGQTVWIEVKYERRGRTSKPTPLQVLALRRLGGLLVTYREGPDGHYVLIDDYRFSDRFDGRRCEYLGPRFDHEAVVDAIESRLAQGETK